MQRNYLEPEYEQATPETIRMLQLDRLQALLQKTWSVNPFYREHWKAAGARPEQIDSLDGFSRTNPERREAGLPERPARGTALRTTLAARSLAGRAADRVQHERHFRAGAGGARADRSRVRNDPARVRTRPSVGGPAARRRSVPDTAHHAHARRALRVPRCDGLRAHRVRRRQLRCRTEAGPLATLSAGGPVRHHLVLRPSGRGELRDSRPHPACGC